MNDDLEPQRLTRAWHTLVGALMMLRSPAPARDQRGLSQSTENAVLLTGAVAIAAVVVGLVGTYVARRLEGLG